MGPLESSFSSCAIVSGLKAWRNGHSGMVTLSTATDISYQKHFSAGIISADTVANVLIASVVLAENHIGIALNFYKVSSAASQVGQDAFSGVVASNIIGSLSQGGCAEYTDSNWKRQCQVCATHVHLFI